MPFTEEEKNRLREYSKEIMGGRVLPEVSTPTVTVERPRREPEGVLLKVLDYAVRPLYASAAFSKAIVENKTLEDALKASIRGLTGQERVFYSDVLKSAGVKNKYVRAVAGLALDIGLDPVTYLTLGAGAGAKLGLTTLNKTGRIVLTRTLRRQLPKLTERNMAVVANRRIAEQMARESIEEGILRMALKEPQKYISEPALRIFGKKIPIVSDVFITATKMVAPKVGKIPGMKFVREQPMRWFGEKFIGDEYIIKHAKNLTIEQKNLLMLSRQQTRARTLLGGELAIEKSLQIAEQIPKVADRELIAHAIEKVGKGIKVPVVKGIPKELKPLAREARKYKSAKEWWKNMNNETRVYVYEKLGLGAKFGERNIDWVKRLDKGISDFYNQAVKGAKAVGVPMKKATYADLLPEHLIEKAKEVERFIFKEITEPEAQQGLLTSFRKGYVPHHYKERMAGILSRDIPHPVIARNRFGRTRIFNTLEDAIKAGWQPIEDIAVSLGLRNAYSKRIIAIDDYVQKMLSTVAIPLSKKSVEWKTMVKMGRVPEGMGIYIPRGAARFYPLYNSSKKTTIQIGNAKAIKKLFKAEGTGGFYGGELLKELRLTPVRTAFKVSDDIPVYLLPKEIADMMNAISPYMTREVGRVDMMKYFDAGLNLWKASVTSWWPGFHARNAMSNLWLAFLGGLKNPVRFYDSARLQWYAHQVQKGRKPADFVIRLGGTNYKASQLVKYGKETGVLYRGWFGTELGKSIEQEIMLRTGIRPRLTGKQKGLETARTWALEKPRMAGTAVENNARLALFLDQLDKGIDIGSAARHTKKFLFDYGELTQFEKKVMRKLFPFYTWIRKNLPLEVEMLFRQPGKFGGIKKTQEEFESLSERPDEKYLPDWMREKELFVRLPAESKDRPLYMNFDFAFQDLARLNLANPDVLREWYGFLRPDLKAITEILTNYNMYFGRNIVDPNLPEEVKFRKILKEELLSNMRITGYYRRMTKEDVGKIPKILDFVLGLKPYPYDEVKSRYWYHRRKQAEQRALRKEQLKKKK